MIERSGTEIKKVGVVGCGLMGGGIFDLTKGSRRPNGIKEAELDNLVTLRALRHSFAAHSLNPKT